VEQSIVQIKKAVIVAGGRGTRFLPATLSLPKEVMPVVDTPMIHYMLEEAVAAGVREIVLISAPGKEVMDRYVTLHGPELARALGEHPSAARVKATLDAIHVTVVYQTEPLGVGHAVLTTEEAIGDEPFAAFLPDDIIDNDPPALAQMVEAYESYPGIQVAVERVPREMVSAYGIVACEPVPGSGQSRLRRVTGLVEKPRPEDAPSDLGIVGRYILPPEIFDAIRRTPPGAKGEFQITDAMELLRRQGAPTYAYEFQGVRYDVGNPLGHLRASVALALKRPDIGPRFREVLRDLLTT
jgi:UTP--glucose-1-phosphate uridylyltransferase